MTSVLFSILLPVYNVAPYLKRCMESVLRQDCSDCEIILVDDGATDNSPVLCDEYASQYDRVRVIHKENGGLSSARNAGLAQARGKYIWWVDSDDWIEPDALEKLRDAICAEPDIIRFNHYRAAETRQPFFSIAKPGLYEGEACEALLDQAFFAAGKFGLSAWSHVWRRDFLLAHGASFVSEREVGSEDYLFALTVYPHARSIVSLADCLYDYELRQGSLSQTYKKDLPGRYAELYSRLLQAYSENGLLEACQKRISHFYIWHLVRGTCLPYEYHDSPAHPMKEGRRNVRAILRSPAVRQALGCMDPARLSFKDRVLYAALRCRMEPLLYWLYAVKPGLKKGK